MALLTLCWTIWFWHFFSHAFNPTPRNVLRPSIGSSMTFLPHLMQTNTELTCVHVVVVIVMVMVIVIVMDCHEFVRCYSWLPDFLTIWRIVAWVTQPEQPKGAKEARSRGPREKENKKRMAQYYILCFVKKKVQSLVIFWWCFSCKSPKSIWTLWAFG